MQQTQYCWFISIHFFYCKHPQVTIKGNCENKKGRLTEHGHFRVFSHAAQRRMRVEPDHRGMHEKLSHRDLCDLREAQGTADSLRESRGGRTSQALSFSRHRLSVSVNAVTLQTQVCAQAQSSFSGTFKNTESIHEHRKHDLAFTLSKYSIN